MNNITLELMMVTPFGQTSIEDIKLTKEQAKQLIKIFDSGGEIAEVFVNGYEG